MSNLKGQDITIKFLVDGKVQATLGHFLSFDETADIESIRDEYIGDTAETPDHVFKIFLLKFTAHMSDEQWENLEDKIIKAMRYLPGGVSSVNVLVVKKYPRTGKITKRTYINVKFGTITKSAGSRTDRMTVDFECMSPDRV